MPKIEDALSRKRPKFTLLYTQICLVKALGFGFEQKNLQKHKWDNKIAAAGPGKDRQHLVTNKNEIKQRGRMLCKVRRISKRLTQRELATKGIDFFFLVGDFET